MQDSLRKIITIVLLAGLLTVIVLGFLWLRLNFAQKLSPQQAIPEDFVVCLETTNYGRLGSALQNHSNIWLEFQEYSVIEKLDSQIHIIDSLRRNYAEMNGLFEGDVLISLHPPDSSYSTLFALASPENKATDLILKLISNEAIIQKEKIENVTCYHLDFKQGFPSAISFAETRGLLIFSPSREMLQKSLMHIALEKNVFIGREYERIRATAGSDVEAHVYTNFPRLESFMAKIIKKPGLPEVSSLGAAAALDLEIKPNHFVLNGFSSMNDTTFQLFHSLKGQRPVVQELFPMIPSSVVYLKWLGLSDPSAFAASLEVLYPDEGGHLRSFRQGFYSLFNGQVAEVRLKKGGEKVTPMMLVSVKSGGIAEDFLKENMVLSSGLEELTSEKIPAGDASNIIAYKIAVKGLIGLLFGNYFKDTEPEWFCTMDNFLVMGNSPTDLKNFIYENSLGKTLENDPYFQHLKENFSSRSNYFVYADPSRCYDELLETLQPDAKKIMEAHPVSWRKLNAAGFQSTVEGDLNYFRIFVNYTGEVREYVNTVWERKLDGQLSIKPFIVLNHESGEKEIFIQDEDHALYLIGNRGELLWKQKVDGTILSEVYQIDYYNNGRLQYLFNTESRIYLIDRNGNNVGNFPVELREKASAGLSLFDYDRNKDYRIPVPTTGKDILMYDRHGKIVTGWNFEKSDHMIRFPLEHYRLGDKDFIIGRDDFRLYFLDRRGKIRVKPERQIDFSPNNPVYFIPRQGNKAPRILASDKNGSISAFYFDGKVERLSDQDLSAGHYFLPSDLNGDSRLEYIFTDSTFLKVYNSENRLMFEEAYPDEITFRPFIYTFSSTDKKIGIVLPGSGRIYLVNNDGSVYKGFPLKGSSYFSIASFPGLEDRFNLIVGHKDNFLYNYSVK